MAKEGESLSYSKGAITRIELHDFLTYNTIVLHPGPKLNLLFGPNGTGKSSFICGIILGLGGKPQVIGRSPHIGEFVRHNCERATIEIELYNPNGNNYVIKRTIVSTGSSSWFLQGKSVSLKKVEELIKKLNIQVDNLCQLLPQDRVQDFAKMNKKQLLESTQKSIGNVELFDWFEKLKTSRADLVGGQEKFDTLTKRCDEENQKMLRMENDVKQFKARRDKLRKLTFMKQKIAWLYYEEKGSQKKKLKDEAKKIEKEVAGVENQLKPLQNIIKSSAKEEQKIRNQIKEKSLEVSSISKSIATVLRTQGKYKDQIIRVNEELKAKVEAEKKKESNLLSLKTQLGVLKESVSQLSEEMLKNKIRETDMELESVNRGAVEVKTLESEATNNVFFAVQCVKALEYQKSQALNVKQKKIELMSNHKDLYQAYQWLEQNRHEFTHNIYGPLFMELNIKTPSMAKYVERVISTGDLLAFACEDVEDMNKLLRILRDQLNLRINVIHTPPPQAPVHELFVPPTPISELRKFGFHCYLLDLVEGPEPILGYLCGMNALHRIPVGDSSTEQYMDSIPSSITSYFTDMKHIRTLISKYSNEKMRIVNDVMNSKFLAVSINTRLISDLDKQLAEKIAQRDDLKLEFEKLCEERKKFDLKINKLRNQKRELSRNLESLKANKVCIRLKQEEINQLENTKLDMAKEQQNAINVIKQCSKDILQQEEACVKHNKNYLKTRIEQALLDIKLEIAVAITAAKERDASNLEIRLKEKRADFERMMSEVTALKKEEHELFLKAKELCNGLVPDKPEFTMKLLPNFKQLPNTIYDLENLILENEAMAHHLRNPEEETIMKNYRDCKNLTESLQKELDVLQNRLSQLREETSGIKEKWVSKMTNLIGIINSRFSSFFEDMGCVGVVELDKGTNEEEYENYGICIKVKFRNENDLQCLDSYTQSGGERALTTAVYLLSMQGVTNVPFRCVDEINQGMDETNERRVYDLLLHSISQTDTAQYFLLSPKLLNDMRYSEECMIHFIFNGHYSVSHTEWSLEEFGI